MEKGKDPKRKHASFLAMIIAFAGLSLYTVLAFFNTNNMYIDQSLLVSALKGNDVSLKEFSDVPFDCYTCPEPRSRYADCEKLWEHDRCPLDENDSSSRSGSDEDNGDNEGNEEPSEPVFEDVPFTHKNAEAIEAMYYLGIVGGYGDGTFKPENPINRAEFLKILTTAIDADFGGLVLQNCFTDVTDEWFSTFICYAKHVGWVNGYQDGTFKPEQGVSKAEAVKMALEAFGLGKCEEVVSKPFADADLDDWFTPYACKAKEEGVVESTALFGPHVKLTRGEICQIVYNIMVVLGQI